MKSIIIATVILLLIIIATKQEFKDLELQLNHSKKTYCEYYQSCYEKQDNTIYHFDKRWDKK